MVLNEKLNIPKSISILGSTGSIGKSTLDLISLNKELYNIELLTCFNNYQLLAEQAIVNKANKVVIVNESYYKDLKSLLSGKKIEVLSGREALIESASIPVDLLMSGIVGIAGLEPSLSAIKQGTTVALANKECLVSAGNIFMSEVKKNSSTLLPVDSEHNGIFQILNLDSNKNVDKIIITASGGPFLNLEVEKFYNISPDQALMHPNWSMGPKISIDSATMMNKGLELIEAYFLFVLNDLNIKLDLIVHPQSIVHGMVYLVDGSVIMQMSTPDMRVPISYTLNWPERTINTVKKIDLAEVGNLEFKKPDLEKFPAIKLCKEVLYSSKDYGVALNAANEEAVIAFLEKKIGFTDIVKIVENVLNKYEPKETESIKEVIHFDKISREIAKKEILLCMK